MAFLLGMFYLIIMSHAPQKGNIHDIVKLKKSLYHRTNLNNTTQRDVELFTDLAEVLANMGIILCNVKDIAKELGRRGWIKTKKVIT
jgi:hypothetical protein